MYNLLINAPQLQTLLAQGTPCAIFDCSFDLMKPELADGLFEAEHIEGAVQAHLDRDLSTHEGDAVNGGRHPLPPRERGTMWSMFASPGVSLRPEYWQRPPSRSHKARKPNLGRWTGTLA